MFVAEQTTSFTDRSRLWLRLSLAAGLLSASGSVIALSVPQIYAVLTPAFLPEAMAQDLANIAVVIPLWCVLAGMALHGSWRAYLLWLGALAFTVYNYVIYTVAIPFGPLFPLWVVVLGLSLYALIGGIASIQPKAVELYFANRQAVTATAVFLVVTAVLFGVLWLSEDVPALTAGKVPRSVVERAIPTNPVHVLDYAFFLPAAVIAAMFLLRQRPLGYILAPAFLVFLILTGVPILLTPPIQGLLGQKQVWVAVVPIGILTVVSIADLAWLMSSARRSSGTSADRRVA